MSKIATCAGARAMVLAATAALAGCALGPRSHTGLEHRAQGVDTATVAWAMAELCRDEHPATDPRAGGPVPVLAHADGSFTIQIARLGIGSPYRCAMDGRLTEPTPELRADGALVLSEFPGAADELRQGWLLNPYDLNGMKQALLDAARATPRETGRRMRAMRRQVMENDVKKWADTFLDELVNDEHRTAELRPPRHF